tara:strand:- start:1392 stop:1982 length:591 start_codon:yes stop_codon:yes gene_type:complete
MVELINNISIEDVKKVVRKLRKNNNSLSNNEIYREFLKINDSFIATNNFFLTDEIENNKINFNKITNSKQKEKLLNLKNNIYEYNGQRIYNEDKSYVEKKFINLLVICDIEFRIDEININNKEIFKKFIENEKDINESLFNDIYFNEKFSSIINIELPKTKKKLIEEEDNIEKKYLFKIKINELGCNYYVESNNKI